MGIIIKDRNPLISFILTDYGKKQMSLGKLSFDYYAFGDSDIDYRTADINSSTLKPSTSTIDLKTLLYKKDNNCFHPISESNIESEDIVVSKKHEFNIWTNENNVVNLDKRFIGIQGEIIKSETPYIINVEFDSPINKDDIKILDFITIYLSDEFEFIDSRSFDVFHCQIENIIVTEKTAKIFLKQPINDNLSEYRFFITSSNFLFFDNKSWNQIYCGSEKLPSNEPRFDGIREYFNSKDGLLIYHPNEIDLSDFIEIGSAESGLYIPTIMWDKSPVNKMGLKLTSDVSIDNLDSLVNSHFSVQRVSLKDEYGNRVGYYIPQNKMFYINDIELSTTMACKNGRNWTLPEISYEYIPSNGNGIFNKTNDDLYVTYILKGCAHNNTAYCRKVLYVPNRKGDNQINLDFSQFSLPSLMDGSRLANEIAILYQFVPSGKKINPNKWNEITMLKSEKLTIENIRGKYGFNNQHINRGVPYQNNLPNNLDEQLFLGNVYNTTQTKKYKTTFNFSVDNNSSLHTSNPTYINSKDIRVSEVAVYDKKYNVVAYAKLSHSIRWRSDIVFTIKAQMIF